MAKRNRLIPFSWRNILLGLEGKTKAKAEAEYYYTGQELEKNLAEIEYDNSDLALSNALLDIDLKYSEISEEEYRKQKAELNSKDETELKLELLKIDYDLGKLSENDYEKEKATINGDPWVVAELHPDPRNPMNGYFDIDWNEYFIKELENAGYKGGTEEDIIEQWLRHVHANQLYEAGVIDPADVGTPDRNVPESQRRPRDDQRAEYS